MNPPSAVAIDVGAQIERALSGFLDERAAPLPEAADLLREIDRVVASGGKRLRPSFCVWGYRAGGGAYDERIVRAAASLELLHTFAIVHDDVMDGSPTRRGAPATYRVFARAEGVRDPERFGVAAAILAGDLAMALADELWWGSGFDPERLAEASALYHRMRAEVIGGQYLDLLAAARGGATPEETRRISVLKSGRYTVERPLAIGAALAGAPVAVREALHRYGEPLGEAFQHRDDVLGAFGDPLVTGKDAHGDLREGKQTLLVALARRHGSDAHRALLDRTLGSDLDARAADAIRDALRDSGALEMVLEHIDQLVAQARAALDPALLPPDALDALDELAVRVAVREL